MTRHRRKRNSPPALASDLCYQCMQPKIYCSCRPGRHRIAHRRPTRTVLHKDTICVPTDPPIWRGVLAAVVVAAGLVAGWGVTVPSDVVLTSCGSAR